jgi:hypothetical protein
MNLQSYTMDKIEGERPIGEYFLFIDALEKWLARFYYDPLVTDEQLPIMQRIVEILWNTLANGVGEPMGMIEGDIEQEWPIVVRSYQKLCGNELENC